VLGERRSKRNARGEEHDVPAEELQGIPAIGLESNERRWALVRISTQSEWKHAGQKILWPRRSDSESHNQMLTRLLANFLLHPQSNRKRSNGISLGDIRYGRLTNDRRVVRTFLAYSCRSSPLFVVIQKLVFNTPYCLLMWSVAVTK
jgi:hypothetical protein